MSDRSDISVAKVLASFATVLLFSVHTNYAGEFDIVVKDCAIVQRCVTDQDARNIALGMPGGFSYSFDSSMSGSATFSTFGLKQPDEADEQSTFLARSVSWERPICHSALGTRSSSLGRYDSLAIGRNRPRASQRSCFISMAWLSNNEFCPSVRVRSQSN